MVLKTGKTLNSICILFTSVTNRQKPKRNYANAQTKTIFSSSCSSDMFGSLFVPLGFDKDFFRTEKKYLEGVVHFGLMGKFEKRKHTAKIIKAWVKKYGNNNKYQLTCCITNPFYKNEEMNSYC